MKILIKLWVCMMGCLMVIGEAVAGMPPGAHQSPERCDKWEKVLSNQRTDRKVILVEGGCSGFSNGLGDSIVIVFPTGTRITALTYEDAGWNADFFGHTAPSVEWIAHDRLKISIGAVSAIQKKVDRIHDVIIEYSIGHVIYNLSRAGRLVLLAAVRPVAVYGAVAGEKLYGRQKLCRLTASG
jgi:hypothetical protein